MWSPCQVVLKSAELKPVADIPALELAVQLGMVMSLQHLGKTSKEAEVLIKSPPQDFTEVQQKSFDDYAAIIQESLHTFQQLLLPNIPLA